MRPGLNQALEPPRRRVESGFSLLDVFLGLTVLLVAIVSQAGSLVASHRLSIDEQARSEGLHVVQQLIERLRADEDWPGLYARLRTLSDAAEAGGPIPDTVALDDGRRAYVPQAYFPDFSLSAALSECHVLIEVPSAPLDLDPMGPAYLREDVTRPAFGLPADLDGDGALTGDALDATYVVLPVRMVVRWTPTGEASRELKVPTWLRGDR